MKTKNLVSPNDAAKSDIDPLTVRICKLLRDDGDMTVQQLARVFGRDDETVRTTLRDLIIRKNLTKHHAVKGKSWLYHFESMPGPSSRKPSRKQRPVYVSTTGIIVPPRYVPPFKPMRARDIFELRRLCVREKS